MDSGKLKSWKDFSPAWKAGFYFIAMTGTLLLFKFIMDNEDFLETPLKFVIFSLGLGTIGAYIVFAGERRKQQGQEFPTIHSTPLYQPITLIIRIISVLVIVICIGILLAFQIENWGGSPDRAEQIMMKLVGLAFLIPLSALYLVSAWKYKENTSGTWWVYALLAAVGLYFWIANYAWLNPVTSPPVWYVEVYPVLTGLPFILPLVMMLPIIFWLVMIRPSHE
ncbi:MAG: hypothetical protein HC804_01405 [Anaerolineae bacterium]|nr:hypothetical protein [Anaerolineae bacterium]